MIETRRHRVRRVLRGPIDDAIRMRPTKAERVCMDSLLEGAGFELLVPQINSPVLAPDATAGISLMFVFDAHLA